MIKQCLVCGKDFKTYPSKILLGRGKYCSKECCLSITNINNSKKRHQFKLGERHKWQKHISVNWAGYIEIYSPNHPFRTKRGYVKEHRLIMEEKIGRHLTKDEDVHHINGNKKDNNIENLELIMHSEHTRIHNPIMFRWNGGGAN